MKYKIAALAVSALFGSAAFGQGINPKNQIHWGAASGCTTAGTVYSPASGTCIAAPAPTATNIQSALAGLSSCTSGTVYSPASGTCIAAPAPTASSIKQALTAAPVLAQARTTYASGTTYAQGALVADGNGNSWVSLTDNNTGNTPSPSGDTTYWRLDLRAPGAASSPSGSTAGQLLTSGGSGNALSTAQAAEDPQTHLFRVAGLIQKLPKIDVTHPDFLAAGNCANAADPTGVKDSTCAIQAAINYSLSQSRSTFGNAQGIYYPVYLPAGHYKATSLRLPALVSLIGDSRSAVAIHQIAGTAASLITFVPNTNPTSTGTAESMIAHIILEGSGHTNTGALLEVNAEGLLIDDVQYYNTGGRGLQVNNAERIIGNDLKFEYVRWPMVFAGDNNESYFYSTHLDFAGQTDEGAPSGSAFDKWCYGVNCTAGSFAAGNSTTPTVLKSDPYGSIYISKAVDLGFFGGTDKTNNIQSAVRSSGGFLTTFHNFYSEASNNKAFPSGNHAYIVGGSGIKTYLTSALAAGTGATASFSQSSGTPYVASVNDGSWMPLSYGSVSDVMAFTSSNYNPIIMIPQDYDPADTSASAYASGLNKNQYEVANLAGFTVAGQMILSGRNNIGNAPANYAWPAGTIVEVADNVNGQNGLEIDNSHMNVVQGSEGNSQFVFQNSGEFPGGEIVTGVPADTVNLNANPALNQNGFFRGYHGGNRSLGSISSDTLNTYLRIKDPDIYAPGTASKYSGSINAVGQLKLTFYGSPEDVNGGYQSTAATTRATATTPQTLNLGPASGGGGYVYAQMGVDGTTVPVDASFPVVGGRWNTTANTWEQKDVCWFGNSFHCGINYQTETHLFHTPAGTTGGNSSPDFALDLYANSAYFSNPKTGTNYGHFDAAGFHPDAGIAFPGNYSYPTGSVTMTAGQTIFAAPVAAGTTNIILPQAVTAGQVIRIHTSTANPFILTVPGGTATNTGSTSLYINNEKFAQSGSYANSTVGASASFTFPGYQGDIELTTDSYTDWVSSKYVPEIGPVTAVSGAGINSAALSPVSGVPNTVSGGQFTFTSAAAGTSGSAGITITFTKATSQVPKGACVVFMNIAQPVPGHISNLTTGGFTWTPDAALPAGSYTVYYSVAF